MNLLTLTRLACNILLISAGALLLVLALSGWVIGPLHLFYLGALAVAGGFVQFVMSVLRPKTIKPAWDEQTVASHRGAYQFGYWAALICFWVFLAADVSGALLWTGIILVCAPSIWMAIATLSGRA